MPVDAPPPLRRTVSAALDVRAARDEDRTVPVSLSSEEPVNRGSYMEVLDHRPEAVDLRRARDGLPLLWNHEPAAPIGVVEKVRLVGKRLEGVARFGRGAEADGRWQDVRDGILRNLSIGYAVHESRPEPGDVVRAVRWEVFEASLVGIPADPTVGVNRAFAPEGGSMSEQHNPAPAAVSAPAAPAAPISTRAASSALDAERGRVAEILAVARSDHFRRQIPELEDLAETAVRDGTPAAVFHRRVLDGLGGGVAMNPGATRVALDGLARDDEARIVRDFSLARAIRAATLGDWRQAGFEREVSTEIARATGREPAGFFVPAAVLATRAASSVTATTGRWRARRSSRSTTPRTASSRRFARRPASSGSARPCSTG
jgi:HK97 family phage prohead protease